MVQLFNPVIPPLVTYPDIQPLCGPVIDMVIPPLCGPVICPVIINAQKTFFILICLWFFYIIWYFVIVVALLSCDRSWALGQRSSRRSLGPGVCAPCPPLCGWGGGFTIRIGFRKSQCHFIYLSLSKKKCQRHYIDLLLWYTAWLGIKLYKHPHTKLYHNILQMHVGISPLVTGSSSTVHTCTLLKITDFQFLIWSLNWI